MRAAPNAEELPANHCGFKCDLAPACLAAARALFRVFSRAKPLSLGLEWIMCHLELAPGNIGVVAFGERVEDLIDLPFLDPV